MANQAKSIYKTNIGDVNYQMLKDGKRFHVLRKGRDRKKEVFFSGTDFGEACYELFKDGFTAEQKKLQLT